eukprot:6209176-Pleurochrysis_carterae.AAC.1
MHVPLRVYTTISPSWISHSLANVPCAPLRVIKARVPVAGASTCSDAASALTTAPVASACKCLLRTCSLRHRDQVARRASASSATTARVWPCSLPTPLVCSSFRCFDAITAIVAAANAVRRQLRMGRIVAQSLLRCASHSVRTCVS